MLVSPLHQGTRSQEVLERYSFAVLICGTQGVLEGCSNGTHLVQPKHHPRLAIRIGAVCAAAAEAAEGVVVACKRS